MARAQKRKSGQPAVTHHTRHSDVNDDIPHTVYDHGPVASEEDDIEKVAPTLKEELSRVGL